MTQMRLASPESRTQPTFAADGKSTVVHTQPTKSALLLARPLWIASVTTLLWLMLSLLVGAFIAWLFIDEPQKPITPKIQEPLPVIISPPPVALESCETTVRTLLRKEKIHFATASANISAKGMKTLDKVINALKKCKHAELLIEGHTDNTGSATFNKQLSLARANAVADVLKNANLDTFNFKTRGRGSEAPIAANTTTAGRYQNRRIELYLNKIEHEESQNGL